MKAIKIFLDLFFVIIFMSTCKPPEPEPVNIIPRPERFWVSHGTVKLNSESRILFEDPNPELNTLADFLAQEIKNKYNISLQVVPLSTIQSLNNDILLTINLNDSVYGSEGYILSNNNQKLISIQANKAQGVFRGIQSLFQILPEKEIDSDVIKVPSVNIQDKPRFNYRGMHLDVARHFFPVAFVKQYIDLLAYYKFNYFHWHLTEDQGWRIEIKQYPELTTIGSKRKQTIVGHQRNSNKVFDGIEHSGFYTQDEIREVVAYAASKYITIIPEIEMPGHSTAALAAYPNLGCTGGPYEVEGEWGIFEDVFCTKDETFVFLENVLTEVSDLFPGEYIHIGGDEVLKNRWKACPDCQKRIKSENLSGEAELQSYFIHRIEKIVAAKGKKIIGWDEILEGGLAPNATVMSWRGTEGGIEAARMNHDVIMTPGSHCYFDHYQANPKTEPLAIGGLTRVSKVYDFEPIPEELNAREATHILGAQANVWTEYLCTPEDVTYMILPRMAALSEVLWSPKDKRDWEHFYKRLPAHFEYYKKLGLNYSNAVNMLDYSVKINENDEKELQLNTEIPGAEIRYSLQTEWSVENASIYSSALVLKEGDIVKAAIVKEEKQIGNVVEIK